MLAPTGADNAGPLAVKLLQDLWAVRPTPTDTGRLVRFFPR